LPDYYEPYATRLIERAESESKREYTPYEGQRLASENADTAASRNLARGVANAGGIPNFGLANQGTQFALDTAKKGAGFASQDFDSAQAQKYMSPYLQNVLNFQKQGAIEDFNMANAGRANTAIQSGAFGGSRAGIQQGLAQRDLSKQLQGIDATGRQKAYEAATQQFGADRDARFNAEKMSQAAAGQVGASAQQLAALGEKARAGDIESAQILEKIAKDRQARSQAGLDLSYEDFVRQRDQPRSDLQFYSSILRGIPVQPSTETTKFQQYNPVKDLLGTGIAGLGLYKGITG